MIPANLDVYPSLNIFEPFLAQISSIQSFENGSTFRKKKIIEKDAVAYWIE